MARITATYSLETPLVVEKVAALIAREVSTGTFLPLPGETPELRERHGARVENIEYLGSSETAALPSASGVTLASVYNRAGVQISLPMENIGPSLPNLVATVAGGVFDLGQLTSIRLTHLSLPDEFTGAHQGPQFGVGGTRRLAGIEHRPIIGTIMKPSVGMSPEQTAEIAKTLIDAGIDFIKDDECMANPPHSPLASRVKAVMGVVNELADKTGRKAMYAFNITDDLDEMLRHQEFVADAGGTCVMVSINPVGLAGFVHLRKRCALPIHAHRNGWGMLSRYPHLGMDFQPYQLLWRLAGVDQLHCSGIRNKFWDSDDTVVESVLSCLAPQGNHLPVMPVLSSGQWAGQVEETYRRIGSIDLMYVCGGGVIGHPDGPKAGVLSVRQAWDAAMSGLSIEVAAARHGELARALEAFSR